MLPEEIKEAEKKQVEEIQRRVRRSAAFQRIFVGEDGDLALNEIKTFCNADKLVIHKDSTETQIIADTAKKDVWQFIKNCMDVNVEKTFKMLEEFKNANSKTA